MSSELDERAIFVKGPVVIFKWRNEPGWPVEYVSPNAAEVFGYSAEEFLGGSVDYGGLVLEEDAARVAAEVSAATATSAATFLHEPYRVRNRDGSTRWLYDFTHVLRNAAGEATHYLGYVIDITPRMVAEEQQRHLERQLLHAQKLESLGVLAGGVAHDFNNLLTAILGQASLARRNIRPDVDVKGGPEFVHDRIREIEELALRAAELTRQLLAYSGKGHFVVEPTDLGTIVSEMAGMLRVVLSKKAELELDVEPCLPAVLADRAQLSQVLMNLLTNASDSLGESSGHITVRVRAMKIASDDSSAYAGLPPGHYVRLEVGDDGCGMAAEVKAKLFDPFFSTKLQGRGLGMSAVLGIVRGHNGAISVDSEPGRGTTFTLVFPASDQEAQSGRAFSADPAWRGHGTVLVVDDEASVLHTASMILGALGFDTLSAEDGAQALRLFDQNADRIRLVLLDLTMPVLGGREVLTELRKRAPALPIVLSSGYSAAFALPDMKSDGHTTFLQKPYGTPELQRVMQAALGGPVRARA
jgi:two-component system, cell cycle sensor histidine kinase and response regulator CckA